MKLPSTCSHSTGFTLIEVLVVLGMFSIIISAGLAFSFDSYRGYLFRSEYTSVINMIAKARNRALNNFNESAYTFEILPTEYRIYPTNDPSNYDSFPANQSLDISGATTLQFAQLTGNSITCDPTLCTITFSNGLVAKNITVNAAGGILTN